MVAQTPRFFATASPPDEVFLGRKRRTPDDTACLDDRLTRELLAGSGAHNAEAHAPVEQSVMKLQNGRQATALPMDRAGNLKMPGRTTICLPPLNASSSLANAGDCILKKGKPLEIATQSSADGDRTLSTSSSVSILPHPPISQGPAIPETPSAPPEGPDCFSKDSVLVVIENIHVRWDSFDHPDFWNESDEDLRVQLDQEIDLCFRHRRGSRQPHEYLLQFTYAGPRKEELRPSIVITTSSPKTRKLIKKRLASEQVQWILQRLKRDLWVLVDSNKRAAQFDTRALPDGDVRIRLYLSQPSSCGSKIDLMRSRMRVSNCIFGGTLLIGERLFGLTASHPFPQHNPELANEYNLDGGSDEDEDEDEEDAASEDEGPFCIPWDTNSSDRDGDSINPGQALKVIFDASDEDVWISDSLPSHRSTNRSSSLPIPSQSRHFHPLVSADFFPTYDGPTADWAAFEIPKETVATVKALLYRNEIGANIITDVYPHVAGESVPVVIALPDGEVAGTLRSGPVIHRVGTQVFQLRLVTVDRPIPPGCSGAWVVSANQLCGVVLVVKEDLPWIYMLPFEIIKRDIENVCALPVRLPRVEESQHEAVARTNLPTPLHGSSIHCEESYVPIAVIPESASVTAQDRWQNIASVQERQRTRSRLSDDGKSPKPDPHIQGHDMSSSRESKRRKLEAEDVLLAVARRTPGATTPHHNVDGEATHGRLLSLWAGESHQLPESSTSAAQKTPFPKMPSEMSPVKPFGPLSSSGSLSSVGTIPFIGHSSEFEKPPMMKDMGQTEHSQWVDESEEQGENAKNKQRGLSSAQTSKDRKDNMILSFHELEEQHQRKERDNVIKEWLTTLTTSSKDPFQAGLIASGPNLPRNVNDFDLEYPDNTRPSPPQTEELSDQETSATEVKPSSTEQPLMQAPWYDPPRGMPTSNMSQPSTSIEAVIRFYQEAAKWETASRAASWGSRRRLSESEIGSLVRGSQAPDPSLSKRGGGGDSSSSKKAPGIPPRRADSGIKKEPHRIEAHEAIKPMTLDHLLGKANATAEQAQVMPTLSSFAQEGEKDELRMPGISIWNHKNRDEVMPSPGSLVTQSDDEQLQDPGFWDLT